jgi:hypothetical protein
VWIDLTTGEARSELRAGGASTTLPMLTHSSLGKCASAVRSAQVNSVGRLLIERGAPAMTAACLLQRFFGPQVAVDGAPAAPSVVDLEAGLGPIHLLCDVVVRGNNRISIIGNGNTLQLGQRQIRVMEDGELMLNSLEVTGSLDTSAILVEGKLVMTSCTVRNCSARMNVLSEAGLESRGGGVYVRKAGTVEVLQSRMEGNVAREGTEYSQGGAIYATNGSNVSVLSSQLLDNTARDG